MLAGARGLYRAVFGSGYLTLLLCGALFAGLAPITPGLASTGNFQNLLANLLPLLVVACGQTVVMITGGIDLSAGSVIALCSVLGALVMNGENGWLAGHALAVPAAVMVMLLAGAAVGMANGICVAKLEMPPFIVTLTTMMFFSGFAIWLTQSRSVYNLPDAFTMLGNKLWLTVGIAAMLAASAHLILSRTLLGRWIYTIGHNARTARVSGIPVKGTLISAYIAAGLLAGAASILYTARLETGSPVLGQRILLDIIGATVIGGTSLFGGRGKIHWTFFGVVFLTLLDNALNLLGLSHFTITITKGGVILLAALLDSIRKRSFG